MMPFVALEGCDGAGKTTLRRLLQVELQLAGVPAITVGQHSWLHPWHAQALVKARERRGPVNTADLSEAYLTDKRLHGIRNIRPALTRAVVIADRWFYSDAVYLEVLYGVPFTDTLTQHEAVETLVPDMVVYMPTESDLAYSRILKRGRQTRHYERPADLTKIVSCYDKMFAAGIGSATELLVLPNSACLDALKENVRCHILPVIMSRIETRHL